MPTSWHAFCSKRRTKQDERKGTANSAALDAPKQFLAPDGFDSGFTKGLETPLCDHLANSLEQGRTEDLSLLSSVLSDDAELSEDTETVRSDRRALEPGGGRSASGTSNLHPFGAQLCQSDFCEIKDHILG